MGAIVGTANDLDLEARNVLGPAASDEHDVMLLEVVALARYVGGHFLAVAETDKYAFTVSRVGFLGFLDHRLQHNALHLRLAVQDRFLVGLDPLLANHERRSHMGLPQSDRSKNGLVEQAGQVAVLQEIADGRASYAFASKHRLIRLTKPT